MNRKITSLFLSGSIKKTAVLFCFFLFALKLNVQATCNAQFAHYSINNPDSVHFYPTGSPAVSYSWSFGDGTFSTLQIPWHYYTAWGTYYACLTITDSIGATCTWCDSVHVGSTPPVCNAQFSYYSINNPDSVHFYPLSTSANTYYWSFGDGTFSTSATPWHFYTATGTYYVCLTVTDSTSGGTCTDTWCDSVHVGSVPPVCNAQFSYYSINNPDSVHFYPLSTSANTYYWSFGDGTFSTSATPWHFYTATGTYYVCLTVTDSTSGGTCTDTWCDSVHVGSVPPVCNAQFSYYSINNPDSVHFYPLSTSANTYYWDFGDGTNSNSIYPWHFYAAPGTYYVCLTVTDSTSGGTCTDTWCDSVHVGSMPPVCNAQFSYYSINNPDSVHFYPASTSANTYYWSFGDGTFSTSATPWHFYAATGTYYVCLTVTDSTSGGTCTDTWCDSVHVGSVPPVCNAQFSYYSINNPDSVHFYPLSTSANTYYWDFGDGTNSNSIYPWHFYAASGTYYVCLTVTDSTSGGTCTDTWCDSVHVGTITPVCNAQFAYYSMSNPDSVHFYPTGSSAVSYYWSFGDGTFSSNHDPWHLYNASGTYYACLTIIDSTGSACTWCDSIYINAAPLCNAHFAHYSINNPDSVHFYPTGGSSNSYYWNFGDGTSSTSQYPWHLFAAPGYYYVCLTVTDSTSGGSCTDTWCDTILVPLMPGNAAVYPNPVINNATVYLQNMTSTVSFIIYDNMGREMYRKDNLINGSMSLNTGNLMRGIYLYELKDNNQVISQGRLVIIQ